jgi:hypothetical protein
MTTEINTNGGGSGNVVLSFILGAVLVAVAIVGFFMWDHYKATAGNPGTPAAIHVTVKGN